MFAGLIIIIIGIAFLLKNLGYLPVGAWEVIWPAILIIIGLRLLLKKGRAGFFWEEQFGWTPRPAAGVPVAKGDLGRKKERSN